MMMLSSRILVLLTLSCQGDIALAKLRANSKLAANDSSTHHLIKAVVIPKAKRRLLDAIGYGGTPDGEFLPLGECEGDCDDDSQCEPGLVCYKRMPNAPIPGCKGGERFSSGTDFCIRKLSRNGVSGGLGMCEGDCDDDSQVSKTTRAAHIVFSRTVTITLIGNNSRR